MRDSRNVVVIDRQQLEREIALTTRLLAETASRKQRTVAELRVIDRQIALQTQLVETLAHEIIATEETIREIEEVRCAMEDDMANIQAAYAAAARKAYVAFTEEYYWLALLSASDVSSAYYRSSYFQQYANYRRRQLTLLRESQSYLTAKAYELEERIRYKQALIAQAAAESKRLAAAKNGKARIVVEVQGQEAEYREALSRQSNELTTAINRTDVEFGTVVPETKAKTIASGNFAKARGRLRWPIPPGNGIVITKFGKSYDAHAHFVDNQGIEIRVEQGQEVLAIFEGRVSGVQRVPGQGFMVVLEHGSYRSVYANLANTSVRAGDFVAAGTALGIVRTDPRSQETVLTFQLYKLPNSFIDPEKWLAP